MIVVMSVGATEQDANDVRTLVKDAGLTPHDNYGTQRVVIAVLGDVGPQRDYLMSKLSQMPGVETISSLAR